jgi:hypothetical protein
MQFLDQEDRAMTKRLIATTALLLMLTLGFFTGCEEREPKLGRTPIALDKAPAELLATAQKQLKDVKIDDVWENHVEGTKGIHSYEFRGRNAQGKIREVRVGLDGKILEEE